MDTTTATIAEPVAPRHGAHRRRGRWLGGLLGALMALVVLLGPAVASAEHGEPIGWALNDASEEVIVGRMVVHFEPGLEDEAFGLAEELPQWWSQIEQELAWDLEDKMTIHLVSHPGQVSKATRMPMWVSGVAHPPRGEIVVSMHNPDGSPTDYETVLRHELVHVALYRATGGAQLPRWFHEGVAESLANEISLMRAEALAGAVFGPGVPPIQELERDFHGEAEQASMAYAAARDFTTWLRYHDPESTHFRQLLTNLRIGKGFELAVFEAYDETLEELDKQWHAGLFGRFVWYPLVGTGSLPLLAICPVVVIAWVRRRRKIAIGMQRLADEDAADAAIRAARARLLVGY